MPREIEKQADQFASAPHMRFQDLDSGYPSNPDAIEPGSLHDHAYHTETYQNERDPYGQDRQHNWGLNAYEPSARDEHNHELAAEDQDSGYNWGPPPNPNHIHGQVFPEE